MYAACCASVTPSGSPGFVSWPYSVIQIGMFLRWNHESIDVSNRGSDDSETFGHFTFWLGFWKTGYGYGWCAHASNLSRGFAFATSCANMPGDTVSELPASGLSRPCDDVSPIATSAFGFPDLMPV